MCVSFRRSLNFIVAMISHFHHFLDGTGLFCSEIILAGSINFSELSSSPLPRKLSFNNSCYFFSTKRSPITPSLGSFQK